MQETVADPQIQADERRRSEFVRSLRSVPGPIALIATKAEGRRSGLAATAWNSLCADPPMLLACVNRNASAYPLVKTARSFSINLLPRSSRELVAIFSKQRGLEGDARFLEGHWDEGPAGMPMLKRSIVSFECSLEAMHEYGSHSVLIGRVGEVRAGNEEEALLYVDGCFASALRDA
jgi:flavin reductase